MKVALVCIAKNEDFYIEEWIRYHLRIGFDTVFVYENNWRCSFSHSNIIKIPFDGETKQVEAYNNFIKKYHDEYQWAAFFDVDEFLVLKKHKNIKEFINDYNYANGIAVNWVLFGNNGIDKINGEYSVLKRFTKRQIDTNLHIKSIVKLNANVKMNVHKPDKISIIDTNGTNVIEPLHNGPTDVCQLNHYFGKTREEFELKINRGRADISLKRKMEEFDPHNYNEIEDLTAYNFYFNDYNNLLNT
jgi:hypothetical protein